MTNDPPTITVAVEIAAPHDGPMPEAIAAAIRQLTLPEGAHVVDVFAFRDLPAKDIRAAIPDIDRARGVEHVHLEGEE